MAKERIITKTLNIIKNKKLEKTSADEILKSLNITVENIY